MPIKTKNTNEEETLARNLIEEIQDKLDQIKEQKEEIKKRLKEEFQTDPAGYPPINSGRSYYEQDHLYMLHNLERSNLMMEETIREEFQKGLLFIERFQKSGKKAKLYLETLLAAPTSQKETIQEKAIKAYHTMEKLEKMGEKLAIQQRNKIKRHDQRCRILLRSWENLHKSKKPRFDN